MLSSLFEGLSQSETFNKKIRNGQRQFWWIVQEQQRQQRKQNKKLTEHKNSIVQLFTWHALCGFLLMNQLETLNRRTMNGKKERNNKAGEKNVFFLLLLLFATVNGTQQITVIYKLDRWCTHFVFDSSSSAFFCCCHPSSAVHFLKPLYIKVIIWYKKIHFKQTNILLRSSLIFVGKKILPEEKKYEKKRNEFKDGYLSKRSSPWVKWYKARLLTHAV